MMSERPIVGVVPAAGSALRVAPLPCSKELFPVAFQESAWGGPRPVPVCRYLLDALKEGGASRAHVVLSAGKWDIAGYLQGGEAMGVPLSYLVIRDSPGVPYTVDRAYPFVRDATVLFGFPDMVFSPETVFQSLLERQATSGADVTLGLFTAVQPAKMDMVVADATGAVLQIEVKPAATSLTHTWIVATWTPPFTEFLHEAVAGCRTSTANNSGKVGEWHLGHVLQSAIHAGLAVEGIPITGGTYRDIGTPEDLVAAWITGASSLR